MDGVSRIRMTPWPSHWTRDWTTLHTATGGRNSRGRSHCTNHPLGNSCPMNPITREEHSMPNATIHGEAKPGARQSAPDRSAPVSTDELKRIDAYWRAANYLSVGQI